MLDNIIYKAKGQIIEIAKKNAIFDGVISSLRSFIQRKRTNPDKSNSSKMILNLVIRSNIKLFPMFGTLLSIYRDGEFLYADDYDFALMEGEELNLEIITKMNNLGASLIAYSFVEDELVELSFEVDGVRLDIFKLKFDNEKVIHTCPNFRKERADIDFSELTIRNYKTYFTVDYPKFELNLDNAWNLYLPNNCERIFEAHYGKDWKTPKKSDFIDYTNYKFIEGKSGNINGHQENLISDLKARGFL